MAQNGLEEALLDREAQIAERSEFRDDKAVSPGGRWKFYKEALSLRRNGTEWVIVLPSPFGRTQRHWAQAGRRPTLAKGAPSV
jgi:hypothetical protein